MTTLKSMTGYAQARLEENGYALRISLRSVNHRFLDLHLRLPEGFEVFEPQLRQRLRDRLRRGHIDLNLYFEAAGASSVHVHQEVAAAYVKAAQELRRQFSLEGEIDVAAVLRLPGVVSAASPPSDQEQQQLSARALACLDEALSRLEQMRVTEGRAMSEDMLRRLMEIGKNATSIESLTEQIRPIFARRLETRLKELLNGAPVEPARLAQEAAMLAERSDIAEEVARLRSHVQQFEKLLAGGGEVGKKLDFLLQEMQREANTMLSKTPGVEAEGLAVTGMALEIKSEIEKLREQSQNIE
ncbi:MAG: YicC family protein [Acidobacteria bacterium]|nr:YicC family protein [Acidobacteriota bacterium]